MLSKEVNLLEYEIDDEGNVAFVIMPRLATAYNVQKKINEEIIPWTEFNNFGEWHYVTEGNDIVFYFKKRSDAVKFKLVWG
jgi:hypothetical protein